jgi:hypothetical protein
VRRDQRDEIAANVCRAAVGGGEMTIDRCRERGRLAGIPGAPNRRSSDVDQPKPPSLA